MASSPVTWWLVASFAFAVWYLEHQLFAFNAMANDMTLIARQSAMLDLQRHQGDTNAYRDALLAYAAALDEARNPDNPLFSESVYRTDKALVAVRLARREREAGNIELADEYLERAIATCTTIPWKDCSGPQLIAFSERLEQATIFGADSE